MNQPRNLCPVLVASGIAGYSASYVTVTEVAPQEPPFVVASSVTLYWFAIAFAVSDTEAEEIVMIASFCSTVSEPVQFFHE